MLTDKEALGLLRQISAAFDELNELWDSSISCFEESESQKQAA